MKTYPKRLAQLKAASSIAEQIHWLMESQETAIAHLQELIRNHTEDKTNTLDDLNSDLQKEQCVLDALADYMNAIIVK